MFSFLRKHQTLLMIIMLVVIVGLPFFGIGTNYLFNSPQDVIVKINGQKVMKKEFDHIYTQMTRQKKDAPHEDNARLMNQAFNELMRMTVFDQEAKRYGIVVPDQELDLMIKSTKA